MKVMLSLLLLAVILSSCQPADDDHRVQVLPNHTTLFTGSRMTIDYTIIIGHPLNTNQIQNITKIIDRVFHHIDSTYNKWNPESELSKLNRAKANRELELSPSLEKFLRETGKIIELSGGRFDPTIEPLQQLWKEKLEKGLIPTEDELNKLLPAIGWKNIHFGNGKFIKDHDQTQLDLGGIAKGLCIDILVEELNHQGWKDIYVEWGGEIKATGTHPEKRPWTIYISHLANTDPSKAIDFIELHDKAIATSGDYLQNWTIREKNSEGQHITITYFHIFDPHTGRPLVSTYNSIASASVVATTCTLADGLATAAMMFPTIEEAQEWAKSITERSPEITFWLISRDKSAILNSLPMPVPVP